MFLFAAVGSERRLDRVYRAAESHFRELSATRWVERLSTDRGPGTLVGWDAGSTHVDVFRNDDGTSFLVRGGYIAGADTWTDEGSHSTEHPETWGEFVAVGVRREPSGLCRISGITDPAGSWPLYYGQREGLIVISNDPHFVGLALGLVELSAQVAFELFSYAHSLGHETTISGVDRLLPGERVSVGLSDPLRGAPVLEVTGRRTYVYSKPVDTPRDTEKKALEALRSAVHSIPPLRSSGYESATLQLSGGLDSRLTVAVLAEEFSGRPDVVTLDLSDEFEIDVAAEVATRLGFPHRVVQLAETDVDTLRAGWLLTGGQVSPYAAAGNILSYETARAADNGRVALVGAWPGDCLIGSYVPLVPGMSSRLLARFVVADWAVKRGKRLSDLGGGMEGKRARAIRRRAVRRLRRAALAGSGSTPAQIISYWGMFMRQPTFSYVSPAMLTAHVLPVTPVLARPYVESLLRLNAAQISGKNFYRSMIVNGFPRLSDVPNASTRRPVTAEIMRASWRPESLEDLYMRMPKFVQTLAHYTIGRLRKTHRETGGSVEHVHWAKVLDAPEWPQVVHIGETRYVAYADSDPHVRAVALGLHWTEEYLKQGLSRIGSWE